jgi:hypothetical protein
MLQAFGMQITRKRHAEPAHKQKATLKGTIQSVSAIQETV